MNLNVSIREVYPHPIEKVWETISTQHSLQAWLMENDFEPRVGHQCRFRFCDPTNPEQETLVYVTVLEITPPHSMVWSWRNEHEPEASRVTFTLQEVSGGTELHLTHTGPISRGLFHDLQEGWPKKVASLQKALTG
ncbi:MAG: hypothetical protein NPIRA02_41180 [Nitrospirales bacterium]|nr:MAG: hypothetical protein NPIRA02_41180 [Nitrospirales bacterium]